MAKLTKIKEDKGVRKEIKKRRYSREELREIWSNRKDRGEKQKNCWEPAKKRHSTQEAGILL